MKLFWASIIVIVHCCVAQIDQSGLNALGNQLSIEYRVVDNLNGNNLNFDASITLVNNGETAIDGGWEIFFYSFYMVEYENLPNPNGYLEPSCNITFFHVNGGLFKFRPADDFRAFQSNLTCNIVIQHWSVSRSDVMPNWYITSGDLMPVTLSSTAQSPENPDFKDDFESRNQYKRYAYDEYDPFTPKVRYDRYQPFNNLDAKIKYVVPTPYTITVTEDTPVKIDPKEWRLVCGTNFTNECDILKNYFKVEVIQSDAVCGDTKNCITIKPCDVPNIPDILYMPESYSLNVKSKLIEITAPTSAGAYYGIQSLISLNEGREDGIPISSIKDAPRFQYRGMHVDVARNFQPKTKIIQLIEVMGKYKLNQLHFHVTDDEGWRVEIDSIPELTSVGGKRGHDLNEKEMLIPQLGSGPTAGTSGSGFYTKEDYKEILRAAVKHHVTVIPEVDLPGHSHAAVKANLAYYNRLKTEEQVSEEEAAKELISDLEDKSVYLSVQYFTDNAVNPCIPGAYTFVDKVVKGFKNLHAGIQELTTFHLGGDEVAGAWTNSPKCEELFAKNQFPNKSADLLEYFMQNASKQVEMAMGGDINIGVWEDGALSDGIPFDINTLGGNDKIVYAWQNIWELNTANRAYKLANAGYKVVLAQATHLYFDQPHEPDPQERGLYWASRFTESKKTFGFMPDNVYSNADVTRPGAAFPPIEVCKKEEGCLPLEKPQNILGMQGNLFSETVLSEDYFDYMVYPRILAMAERAWHKGTWEANLNSLEFNTDARDKDWADFALTLGQKELKRLGDLGIKYRVPLPGASSNGNSATTSCEFPGLQIRATVDDLSPKIQECGETTSFTDQIKYETLAAGANHDGFSRSITVRGACASVRVSLLAFIAMLLCACILNL